MAVTDNCGSEKEFLQVLNFCAGLPLALGIAGSGVNTYYADSGDAFLAMKTYWGRLRGRALRRMRGTNLDYHKDGLKFVVQACLSACDAWARSEGRSYDMRNLFKSFSVLEKQASLPESALTGYWEVDDGEECKICCSLHYDHLNTFRMF